MSVFEMDHAFRPHVPGARLFSPVDPVLEALLAEEARIKRTAELREMLAIVDEREAFAAALVATARFIDGDVLMAVELHALHAGWALADPDEEVTVHAAYSYADHAVTVDVTIDRCPGFRWVLAR